MLLLENVLVEILIIYWQFAHWCDAVIFVFSLENEASFSNIYSYYVKMAHYCDMSQIPMILVGTQGRNYLSLIGRCIFYHYLVRVGKCICQGFVQKS